MSLLQNSNAIETEGGYNINNSLRLRKSATGYLNRTFATPTSSTTWTVSLWFKRGEISSAHSCLFVTSVTDNFIRFSTGSDTLQYSWANGSTVQSTAVFRDPSAWYHLVVAVDTTQATSSNRIRMYINGSEIAYGSSTYPALNATTLFNTARAHYLSFTSNQFDGYVAEVNWIDGQQLTPTSFGETDTTTGVWKPKAYSGTYGTNGFYLKFSDIATTSGSNAGLGKDFSGNSNYWTTNNISVTSGTTYDSMTDSPTLTSATVANYCTLNPVWLLSGSAPTITNANLQVTSTSTGDSTIGGTIGMTGSGKYYAEFTAGTASSYGDVGIINITHPASTAIGNTATSYNYRSTGVKGNNSVQSAYGASYTTNDVIGVAFDLDAGTLTFYKNNTSQGTAFTGISASNTYAFACGDELSSGSFIWTANFGQRPFTYTPPTGFNRLNTYNLPDSTIKKGNSYMDVILYTGTGSSQSISGVNFQPDLVWIKGRSGATDHALYDAVRGVQKQLESNTTTDETTETTGLTAFNANGFTVGALAQLNTNTATYVGWNWKENATSGFDIVTYTGNGINRTIAHGLGVAPKMIIVKARTTAGTDQGWAVYHSANTAAPETDYLLLNSSAATADLNTLWNDTAPTSSVFSVGTNALVNTNNDTYVAYCWAEIAGFSNFGSYTGNGSTNGPFVYTGFRPKFLLIKNSTTVTTNWFIFDSTRDTYNVMFKRLQVNASSAEETNLSPFDFLSNGFKLRDTNSAWNASSATIIYAAFAENPFKNSLAR